MKQIITTKNGTTYEREVKDSKELNTHLHIRVNDKSLEKFKEKCRNNGLEYSEIVRNLMDGYVENYKKGKNNGR